MSNGQQNKEYKLGMSPLLGYHDGYILGVILIFILLGIKLLIW